MTDPFVGKLTYFRVYSGQVKAGGRVLNTTTGKTGAHRPHPADARQPARSARDRRRRDRRRGRPQVRPRVTPSPSSPIRSCSSRCRSPTPSSRSRSSRRRRPTRTSSAGHCSGSPRRTDLPRVLGRGDGADAHRGNGRAAPGDHRRPPHARVPRRGQRRPPAGRVPETIGRPAEKVRGRFVRQTGGSRPVRRRRRQPLPAGARRRVRVRRQDRRREGFRRSTSRRSTPGSRR